MNTLPSPVTLVPNSSYETTRFNALRHGVLSRHTVLPWEDRSEYQTLLDALVAEHAPDGPTEEHLVEELAGIIWRKRRLRMAEAAVYREKLRHDATGYQTPEHLVGAALLPLTGSADGKANIPQALVATRAGTARDLRDVKRDQAMTRNALEHPRGRRARGLRTRRWPHCERIPGPIGRNASRSGRPTAWHMRRPPTRSGPGSIATGRNGTRTQSPSWRTATRSGIRPSAPPTPRTIWMCRPGMKSTWIASWSGRWPCCSG